MPEFHAVCAADQIAAGESRMFVVADQAIGLFNVDGQFYAIDNRCPHAGASLAHGYLDGDIVSCRIHHWRFCVRDGKYVDQDRPACDVRTYPVRVSDGQVEIAV
jgi:NAD(P)H-dependent nitrite reductase small subunit